MKRGEDFVKKKFAFLLMGAHYDTAAHAACFETENQLTQIVTVRDFDEACQRVSELYRQGFGAIELCGAFGKEKAQTLAELTHHEVAIGYVVHEPELDGLFERFFGNPSNK